MPQSARLHLNLKQLLVLDGIVQQALLQDAPPEVYQLAGKVKAELEEQIALAERATNSSS